MSEVVLENDPNILLHLKYNNSTNRLYIRQNTKLLIPENMRHSTLFNITINSQYIIRIMTEYTIEMYYYINTNILYFYIGGVSTDDNKTYEYGYDESYTHNMDAYRLVINNLPNILNSIGEYFYNKLNLSYDCSSTELKIYKEKFKVVIEF